MIKRNHKMMLITVGLLVLLCSLSVNASDLTLSYYYRNDSDPDFPQTLYVGWVAKAGRYQIKLLQDPVVTKSSQYMVADEDTKYLILRVAITNISDEPGGWLAPDSFSLQDTYRGRIYGTYYLDMPVSGKVAWGLKQPAFYSEIKPKETLYTAIAFMVYPDVKSWLLTFAPHCYGEEPEETVRFQLPLAVFEEE